MQSKITYKQVKKVKDDRFEADNIHEYDLLLNVGARDYQVAVLDQTTVLVVEDYVFPSVSSIDDLIATLEVLFDQHAFLKAGFWKSIKISVKNQKLVQVPLELFLQESAGKYLSLNANINTTYDDVLFVEMKNSQAVTIFAVHNKIKNFFEKEYPQKQFTLTHQSASLIEGVMEFAKNRSDNPLYIYVDRFKLHILSVTNDNLIYYNQFSINNFQDYVKYIMLVMSTLGMDQESTPVILWGYIGNNSPHYDEFCKYVRHVTFGKSPSHLSFSYPFDELQEHHYFDLYNINLLH